MCQTLLCWASEQDHHRTVGKFPLGAFQHSRMLYRACFTVGGRFDAVRGRVRLSISHSLVEPLTRKTGVVICRSLLACVLLDRIPRRNCSFKANASAADRNRSRCRVRSGPVEFSELLLTLYERYAPQSPQRLHPLLIYPSTIYSKSLWYRSCADALVSSGLNFQCCRVRV